MHFPLIKHFVTSCDRLLPSILAQQVHLHVKKAMFKFMETMAQAADLRFPYGKGEPWHAAFRETCCSATAAKAHGLCRFWQDTWG